MPIPKYHEFMKPIIQILNDNQYQNRNELYKSLIKCFHLTDEELEERLPSGKQLVYKNRIGWALTYLKKAGLINSPKRAIYKISFDGKKVIQENPPIINKKYLQKYDCFMEFINRAEISESIDDTIADSASPQEMLDSAFKAISDTLADDILVEIMNQTPAFFEKLVVELLISVGYGGTDIENRQVLGKSGDEGIDGIIKEDKLGFEKIYIQAKQWDVNRTINRPELQKFVGALTGQGATKGAFLTTAKFSSGAIDYAKKQHACNIVLIDGKQLISLMIEHNLGVSVSNTYLIKKIDSDYFNDE